MRAEPLEQGSQRIGEVAAQRDVVTGIRSEPHIRRTMVTAPHADVQRHGQAVFGRHPRHLQQHVPSQGHRLRFRGRAGPGRPIDPGDLRGLQRSCSRIRVGVVGGLGAAVDEVATALLHRAHPAGVGASVDAGDLAQTSDGARPAALGSLEITIRAKRRDHPTRPGRVGRQARVRREVVTRVVGRGEHGDVEAGEQRPWPIGVLGQQPGEVVVDGVGAVGRRPDCEAEDIGELGLKPVPHRGGAEDMPVRAEQTPGLACGLLTERSLPDPQRVQRNPGRMQQPGHVVVGGHEQLSGVPERHVVQQDRRVHVTVRGDDRQILHTLVEPAGDVTDRGFHGQEPVRVQGKRKPLALHIFHVVLFAGLAVTADQHDHHGLADRAAPCRPPVEAPCGDVRPFRPDLGPRPHRWHCDRSFGGASPVSQSQVSPLVVTAGDCPNLWSWVESVLAGRFAACQYPKASLPTAGQKDVLVAQCSHGRSVWNMALEQATFWREWQGCTPNAAVRGLR